MMRSKQPMAETEIFEDTEEQFRRRGGEAPRDVMPEDLMPKRPMPKRPMPKRPMPKRPAQPMPMPSGMKHGGKVSGYAKGGSIDGCAQRGKTRGKMV